MRGHHVTDVSIWSHAVPIQSIMPLPWLPIRKSRVIRLAFGILSSCTLTWLWLNRWTSEDESLAWINAYDDTERPGIKKDIRSTINADTFTWSEYDGLIKVPTSNGDVHPILRLIERAELRWAQSIGSNKPLSVRDLPAPHTLQHL